MTKCSACEKEEGKYPLGDSLICDGCIEDFDKYAYLGTPCQFCGWNKCFKEHCPYTPEWAKTSKDK